MMGANSVGTFEVMQWCRGEASAIAIQTSAEQILYSELKERVAQVCSAIQRDSRCSSEPVVGVLLPAGPSFITAFLGALESGAVVVPLEPSLPEERLRQCIDEAKLTLLIGDARHADRLRDIQFGVPVRTFHDLLEQRNESQPPPAPWAGVVLFTSGSTGTPKGVFLPGKMLITEATTLNERLGILHRDRISHLLSPTVIGGLREIFSALLSGAVLFPLSVHEVGLDGLVLRLVEDRITVCRMVSTLLRSVCHALPGKSALSIHCLYVGGEPLLNSDVALFRRIFPSTCRLINVFGATEYGLAAQFEIDALARCDANGSVPIGYPLRDYEVRVVDAEGNDVPRGEIGRLYIVGSSIAQGYWNQPPGSSSPFSEIAGRAGWRGFQTQDLARVNEQGVFEFCGRADTQVKIHGNRVEIGEVESCLLRCPEVLAAAVVDVLRERTPQLYAVVELREGEVPNLRHWCRERLPPVAVPVEYISVASLPRTIQGKADRRELRRLVEEYLHNKNRIDTRLDISAHDQLYRKIRNPIMLPKSSKKFGGKRCNSLPPIGWTPLGRLREIPSHYSNFY